MSYFEKLRDYLIWKPYIKKLLSDSFFLKWQWEKMMGYRFDWNNPKTVNEKIFWLKLHDHNPLYTTLVDKYEAKRWISSKYGDKSIIKTFCVYDNANEIDLSKLPNQFVLKCNHDSGSVFICRDKENSVFVDKHMDRVSFEEVVSRLNEGLKRDYYLNAREWPYKNVRRRILAEELLLLKDNSLPNDYKLFYFNGVFQFVYVSFDREGVNDRCLYDENWNRMPFAWVEKQVYNEKTNTSDAVCPNSYKEMIEFGSLIAKEFKIVRVDFYDVDGKMYLGEITPFHSAGYSHFFPSEYDAIYGEKLQIK